MVVWWGRIISNRRQIGLLFNHTDGQSTFLLQSTFLKPAAQPTRTYLLLPPLPVDIGGSLTKYNSMPLALGAIASYNSTCSEVPLRRDFSRQ